MKVTHRLGFEIEFPDTWHISHDPSPEIALVGVTQPDEFGFSRNVTVSVGSADEYDDTMGGWHEQTLEALFTVLDNAQLIDLDIDTDSFRRVISYVAGERVVVLEQWVRLWQTTEGVHGVTISATTPTLDYPIYAEEMNDIAWSWQEVNGARP